METCSRKSRRRNLRWFITFGLGLFLFFCGGPTFAITNYMFYSVNGDTSATSMIQGDTVAWGANCDIGGSLSWEIWYDIDGDGVIDMPGDFQLVTFVSTDGDTSTESDGLPDISPIPDGWHITPPLILGVAPGQYVFKAVNLTDSSTVQKPLLCSEMSSPPNTFSGWLIVPDHPAPDPTVLKNRWIQAESEGSENQIWSAMTNDSGRFIINIGSVGTGLSFRVSPPDIPGFVSPDPQILAASGHTENVIFTYVTPTDSVWGFLVDENSTVITQPVRVVCCPLYGSNSKEAQTQNGRYVFLFGASELGAWDLGCNWDNLIPAYMQPGQFSFDNSSQHSIRHDFVCPRADTVMYARVTENGGLPAHRYGVYALHEYARVGTRAVADSGANNVATLHISKLYDSNWGASIDIWNDQYPIPPGYGLETSWNPSYHPGDTVDLNLVSGYMVRDTIKSDPGDPPVSWNNTVWVSLWSAYYNIGTSPDDNGVFTLYAPEGYYTLNVNCPGRFVDPQYRNVDITHDTTGGLGFTIDTAHCRVYGKLTNVPLPLDRAWNVHAYSTSGHGYDVRANVPMSTGAYEMYLCDGDWAIESPPIPDRNAPDILYLTIENSPDTVREINLAYSDIVAVDETAGNARPTIFAVKQNYPNPFNPMTTIEYAVPKKSHVKIEMYNLLGQAIRTLIDDEKSAGIYRIAWDGCDQSGRLLSAGVYLYRFQAGDFVETKKMLLLK